MASASSTLIVQCRMALGLTQKELGDIVGSTKRTVQRWEGSGALLTPSQVEALARALCPVRPDLAEQIAAVAGTTLDNLGIAPPTDASPPSPSDAIDSVVRAAAGAMGVTPDAIRPAVAAAFERACDAGLDVQAVAERLNRPPVR